MSDDFPITMQPFPIWINIHDEEEPALVIGWRGLGEGVDHPIVVTGSETMSSRVRELDETDGWSLTGPAGMETVR